MNRVLVMLLLLLAAAGAAAGYGWWDYASRPLAVEPSPTRVRVERGAAVPAIAEALQRAGVQVSGWKLALAARLRGDARAIKAGVYEVRAPTTMRLLLDRLVRGDVLMFEVTVVEGWTFRQMRAALARHPELAHDAEGLDEAALLERIGAQATAAEGWFMPETYRFAPGTSDLEIYRQAYRAMGAALEQAWAGRAADLPLKDPYEVLILASIVEKETGRDADRDKVAAVLVNRLRRGMLLQSDPTTIYGLGERFDGNLRRRDLERDTPYNTYTRSGLPPTPIALPGRASLQAATHPAATRALYFVARGDGSSEFSDDLAAHNRAVARYQLRK
jgi:UPF0755 protein